jgi:hypothetical protein
LLPLLLIAAACEKVQDKPVVYRELTDDDLRVMVLRADDLPPGFTLTDEKLTNNEDYAQSFEDVEKARGLVDTWGRASGLENLFTATEAPDKPRQPMRVSSAVSRYADALKMREVWQGLDELVPLQKVQPNAPKTLDSPRIGQQSTTERWYVTDESGRDLVVYSVTFRKGPVIGSVSTVALKNKDDRGDHAVRLAKLVHERVSKQLK